MVTDTAMEAIKIPSIIDKQGKFNKIIRIDACDYIDNYGKIGKYEELASIYLKLTQIIPDRHHVGFFT